MKHLSLIPVLMLLVAAGSILSSDGGSSTNSTPGGIPPIGTIQPPQASQCFNNKANYGTILSALGNQITIPQSDAQDLFNWRATKIRFKASQLARSAKLQSDAAFQAKIEALSDLLNQVAEKLEDLGSSVPSTGFTKKIGHGKGSRGAWKKIKITGNKLKAQILQDTIIPQLQKSGQAAAVALAQQLIQCELAQANNIQQIADADAHAANRKLPPGTAGTGSHR